MGINIFLFVHFYLFYDLGPQFFYTRQLLGVSISSVQRVNSVLLFSRLHFKDVMFADEMSPDVKRFRYDRFAATPLSATPGGEIAQRCPSGGASRCGKVWLVSVGRQKEKQQSVSLNVINVSFVFSPLWLGPELQLLSSTLTACSSSCQCVATSCLCSAAHSW